LGGADGGEIPLRVSRIDEPGNYATWLEMNAKWLRETAMRKDGELAALASGVA